MSQEDALYRKLQQHLDKMPVAFPATESGVEIRILKQLFSPEEAGIALELSMLPEPVPKIHARLRDSELTVEDLEKTLERMEKKGTIMSRGRAPNGSRRYSKAQFAIGIYEFQVDRLTKELQADAVQYLKEAFGESLVNKKTNQLRTIPINQTVTIDRQVGTYDDIRELVQNSRGPFAVANCICRQGMDLLEKSCQQTDIRRTCLVLEGTARSYIGSGTGQEITREKMLGLLEQADAEGMVLQPENTQNPQFVCCCCGCCCGVLTSAKLFPSPAELFHTNYYAEVEAELCAACETCVERCQMDAIVVDETAEILLDHCIGCGLCVSTCPSGAITLSKKLEELVPPKDRKSLYVKIMTERYGKLKTLAMVGKGVLGMKI